MRITRLGVRLALRWRPGRKYSADALFARLPDELLWPLRRIGLDPVPELGELRDRTPVLPLKLPFGIRGWLVTGYDETRAVLGAADAFSNGFGHVVGRVGLTAEQDPGGLGFADPPDHTRLRRMLTPEFTRHRLRRLVPRIEQIVVGQLDAMVAAAASGEPVDLVRSFAVPIPALTICELLGVPPESRESFLRGCSARFDLTRGLEDSLETMSASLDQLREFVEQQRASPGDGLVGMLVRTHGDELSDRELSGLVDGLLTGGLETTTSMLTLGAIVLMRDPSWRRRLIDPGTAVDPFVDELLRYLTVVQVAFPRVARHDVTVGGHRIAAGDVVLCSLSAANRDGDPDLDRFDPTRETRRAHVAFGYGIHRCLGADLARMELRAAYPALLRRFPDITPMGGLREVGFRPLSLVFGVDSLPVTLGTVVSPDDHHSR
ncbi:MAG: cytochrome P450 [Intrasporangium sp.]|uniref:cytochrome P450 n=1 Tax=Intrasporangium sp. TaxID=1925024 RepID=UPI002649E0F7|nr:cytochrome P450 [Intrasporangium sp.]MDN5796009.1 cytochrome P450 [Intrasporangium sp.]